MTSYSTMAVEDLLDAFASNEPVPGGGSAAALAGAVGVSLLMMVASLPKTRTGAPEEAADLSEAASRLRPLRETLTSLVDQDSEAYQAVLAAYRLGKSTDAEKAARRDAIQTGDARRHRGAARNDARVPAGAAEGRRSSRRTETRTPPPTRASASSCCSPAFAARA